jgi:hypothetical protein
MGAISDRISKYTAKAEPPKAKESKLKQAAESAPVSKAVIEATKKYPTQSKTITSGSSVTSKTSTTTSKRSSGGGGGSSKKVVQPVTVPPVAEVNKPQQETIEVSNVNLAKAALSKPVSENVISQQRNIQSVNITKQQPIEEISRVPSYEDTLKSRSENLKILGSNVYAFGETVAKELYQSGERLGEGFKESTANIKNIQQLQLKAEQARKAGNLEEERRILKQVAETQSERGTRFIESATAQVVAIPSAFTITNIKEMAKTPGKSLGELVTFTPVNIVNVLSTKPEYVGKGIVNVGTIALTTSIPKIVSYPIRESKFIGKTFIPLEKIADKPIIKAIETGKTKFPYFGDTPAELIKRFESQSKIPISVEGKQFALTASPSKLKTTNIISSKVEVADIVSRKTDVPGLYVAPSSSLYFTRLGKIDKISLIPELGLPTKESLGFKFNAPTINIVEVSKFERLPSPIRKDIPASQRFLLESAKKGKAYITPAYEIGKREAEATIVPRTQYTPLIQKGGIWSRVTGFEEYTKVSGTRVAIPKFVLKEGEGVSASTLSKITEKTLNEYTGTRKVTPYKYTSISKSKIYEVPKVSVKEYPKSTSEVISSYTNKPTEYNLPKYYTISAISSIKETPSYVPSSSYSVKLPEYIASSSITRESSYTPPSYTARLPEYITSSSITRESSYTPPSYTTRLPEYTPPTSTISEKKYNYPKEDNSLKQGYNVEVRRQGKWFRIGSKNYDQQSAYRYGIYYTKNTAGVSFRIVKGNMVRSLNSFTGASTSELTSKYYINPKELGVYKQRSTYRISSPGELKEITYKGLATPRNNIKKTKVKLSKFGKFNFGFK